MGRFAPGGKAVKAFAPKAVVAAAAVEAAPEVAVVNPIPDQAYSFAVNYVRKDDMDKRMDHIETMFQRIYDKLDGKADK